MKLRRVVPIFIFILAGIIFWSTRNRFVVSVSEAEAFRSETRLVHKTSPSSSPSPKVQLRSPQIISITSSQQTEDQIFCKILSANTGVLTTGKLKVWAHQYSEDENGEPGFSAMIASSDCPHLKFSTVRVDAFGRLKQFIDCRNTSLEELSLTSSVQGNIQDVDDRNSKVHLAVSGDGYFVLRCEDGFYLSRSGDFSDDHGVLKQNDCFAQTSDQHDFDMTGELDDNGCDSKNSCLALVSPSASQDVTFMKLGLLKSLNPFSGAVEKRRLFRNALEEINPSSLSPGPNWELYPDVKIPNCLN